MKSILVLFILFMSVQIFDAEALVVHSWHLSERSNQNLEVVLSKKLDEYGDLILKQDGKVVLDEQVNAPELLSACLDVNSQMPVMMFIDYMEGVGIEQLYILTHNKGWHFTEVPSLGGVSSVDEIEQCHKASNSRWKLDGAALSCECDFSDADRQQEIDQQWTSLIGDRAKGFVEQSTNHLFLQHVNDSEALELLLDEARKNRDIVFEQTVHGKQWVIVERQSGVYDALSLGLVRQKQQWSIWYYATGNSKAFHRIDEIEQVNPTELNMTLCIDDCDWWGEQARVGIDLETLKYHFIDID